MQSFYLVLMGWSCSGKGRFVIGVAFRRGREGFMVFEDDGERGEGRRGGGGRGRRGRRA